MPERPLLILPAPGKPETRPRKHGGSGNLRLPTRARQVERLTPQFEALQKAIEAQTLLMDATGLTPEEVVVLETACPVSDFIVAVSNIEGLEWLGEVEDADIPPDDDFFVPDKDGTARLDKLLRGRVFMVFTNQKALQQILTLWESWKAEKLLPRGLRKWSELFASLHDVRRWGVRDRLWETGVLADWGERLERGEETVPCEVELWFRGDPQRRQTASQRVHDLLTAAGGQVQRETTIEEIAYHAVLARLPIQAIAPLLNRIDRDVTWVQCEQIQFLRACGQMAAPVGEGEPQPDPGPIAAPAAALGEPVVALFDGLPLQKHERLAGRLRVEDPDGYEADYPAHERSHGTAMASLILHGDLNAPGPPLARALYVMPILRPDQRDWSTRRKETVSHDLFVVDLLHRAVRRLFEPEGEQPPAAPQVCVVNLSIGIQDRPFERALSPLARLLDWLAWKYRVLFIVSAGNHPRDIELSTAVADLGAVAPGALQVKVVQAVAADARHRRLLSPAEAINALTVGAVHSDASTTALPAHTIEPFQRQDLPSVINAQGMGYRRTIKPEVLLPGGRVVLQRPLNTAEKGRLEVCDYKRPPGQRVAAPGSTAGDLTYTCHTRGTSNATALASRAASELYDVLDALRDDPGGDLIDTVPRAVWLKALLVHTARWGEAGAYLEQILKPSQDSRQFKEYVTRLLGYGRLDPARARECAPHRVTALGGGHIQAEQAYVHRFPLPPGLSGRKEWRRLTLTLAWLTPINTKHQSWRQADLWFAPPKDTLQIDRLEADWHAVQRGTVQHEVLEGTRAVAFVDGESLEVHVNCRPDAGALEEPVPYALATTLEVAEEIGVDIYDEVRVRLHARLKVAPGT